MLKWVWLMEIRAKSTDREVDLEAGSTQRGQVGLGVGVAMGVRDSVRGGSGAGSPPPPPPYLPVAVG